MQCRTMDAGGRPVTLAELHSLSAMITEFEFGIVTFYKFDYRYR